MMMAFSLDLFRSLLEFFFCCVPPVRSFISVMDSVDGKQLTRQCRHDLLCHRFFLFCAPWSLSALFHLTDEHFDEHRHYISQLVFV